jgi:hypothetical protein
LTTAIESTGLSGGSSDDQQQLMSSVACLFQRYRRKAALGLGILLTAFVVTFPSTAYVGGAAMGCFDVIVGRPQLLVIGLPVFRMDFPRMSHDLAN